MSPLRLSKGFGSVFLTFAGMFCLPPTPLHAADVPPTLSLTVTNAQKSLKWAPFPAADQYKILSAPDLSLTLAPEANGSFNGSSFTLNTNIPSMFYSLQVVPLTANALLTATALNRLAYGPTPDELERVTAIGPDAYIQEQLAPENITETLDTPPASTPVNGLNWTYVTATGTASSSILYIYLSGAGDCYIDDMKLVYGSVAEAGTNLLPGGDFESTLTPPWTVSPNLQNSAISSSSHSGNGALHVVSTSVGSSQSTSIYQTFSPALTNNATYTLSFWYASTTNVALTVRLSGNGVIATPDNGLYGLNRRLASKGAGLSDLRAWYLLHAVSAKRQLLEVMTQFFDNHFVTQQTKSADYLNSFYPDFTTRDRFATDFEYREISRWRDLLLSPSATFLDYLTVSAESPAMIIYLDTVNSRGDGSQIANENYARELLELFTFGVDNGYDQTDITVMSRAWTGWSVRLVDNADLTNRFANTTTNVAPGVTNNFTNPTNLIGTWSFVYKTNNHYTAAKTLFPGKIVPARFGPPWAGRSYQLALPSRTYTNGILDGYDVLAHLANQPFTEEFVSVKLCRIFVHDNFAIGYDFTDPNLSPEGVLVRDCMLAWENSSPKGNLRAVLQTIFNSALFRGNSGNSQKVKTPLEFVASSIRALRSPNGTGNTSDTDGYALISPMGRMGSMNLFDRAEPDGYPETAPGWISGGTLAERLRFVQSYLIYSSAQSGKSDAGANNTSDPVGLLRKKLPAASWTNAGAVADYFISILYPGEGKANLNQYRTLAVNYLNTADDGITASAFSALSIVGTPSPYDTRVRGMVAMLMTFQRFQEQ